MHQSSLANRNIVTVKGRSSMRLEPELWQALDEICAREKSRLAELIQSIEAAGHPGGRTSAVRVFIVNYFRQSVESGQDGPRTRLAAQAHAAQAHVPAEPQNDR